MKIMENLLLIECFVIIVCGFRVTNGQISSKPLTIWGNQDDHDDRTEQRIEPRSKRSIFECGVHGQEPTIDSQSADTVLPGEWPWVVPLVSFINNVFTFRCSTTLIDTRFAITATRCIDRSIVLIGRNLMPEDYAIMVGVRDVSRLSYDEGSTRFLTAIYFAEDKMKYLSIIALLVLKEPVTYSKLVKPVCLWEGKDDQDDLEKPIQYGTVVGWSLVGSFTTPHQFNVSITPRISCQELNTYHIDLDVGKTFCAASDNGKAHNFAFEGSGLYIKKRDRWMLRGTQMINVLPGKACVYADLNKFRNWISDTAYRWLQNNSLPLTPITYAVGINLSWTQQCSLRDEVISLISGGQYTREGEWPWHIAIYHNQHNGNSSSYGYKCGGSLISVRHVLTAAHCFIDTLTKRRIPKRSINIFLGTNNIRFFSVGVQIKLVDRLEIHQEYNPLTHYKDIALLRLSSPAELTATVRPVCLWPEDEVDLSHVVGKNGSVVGWGLDENGELAEDLKMAELPVIPELTCVRSNIFYYKYTNNFTFCAGLLQDTSVCRGDSGGGMVFKRRTGTNRKEWFLRGIVSLRSGIDEPCDPLRYVVYTDVAKYLDWIKNSVSLDMSLY